MGGKHRRVERVPEPLRPRELVIPKESGDRIKAMYAAAQQARIAADNAVSIVLEALGADVSKRDDGQVWNVLARDDGRLFAHLGPPVTTGSHDSQAIAEALRATRPESPPPAEAKPN